MKRIGTRARFVLGAVILALTTHVLTARLNAQETRGKITGRITDTSKAILPGATVTCDGRGQEHGRCGYPGRQPATVNVRADLGVEPGQLRPARTGGREVSVLMCGRTVSNYAESAEC